MEDVTGLSSLLTKNAPTKSALALVFQVHDPSSNTWTLFDDKKVRHLPGMNSHDPSIAETGTSPAVDAKPRGKAKRNPFALQKKGDRGGGEAMATAMGAAGAELDDGAELLGSADGVVSKERKRPNRLCCNCP